jgi:dolichyl-phosphate beta-glucosyltransferase
MAEVELSVVIPAYNEAGVIRPTLEAVARHLAGRGSAGELIVVDDGSTDGTAELVRALMRGLPSLRLLEGRHRGKGSAVKQGMLAASGRIRLFMDADHSTNIGELERCLPGLRDHDVVIGSRKMPGSIVTVHQLPLRKAMGKVFTRLTNALLGTQLSDITCGFKCFRAEAARRLFSLQRLEGWGFDAEILFLARRLGYRIKEVPVTWANDASTNVRLGADAIRSLMELLQVRLGAWQGWYAAETEPP